MFSTKEDIKNTNTFYTNVNKVYFGILLNKTSNNPLEEGSIRSKSNGWSSRKLVLRVFLIRMEWQIEMF